MLHDVLADIDQGIEWLEKGYEERDGLMPSINTDPNTEPEPEPLNRETARLRVGWPQRGRGELGRRWSDLFTSFHCEDGSRL